MVDSYELEMVVADILCQGLETQWLSLPSPTPWSRNFHYYESKEN